MLIGLFYNHPDIDCAEMVNEKVVQYGMQYDNITLLGDFNTNLLNGSPKTERFRETISSLGLHNVGIEPTFFHSHGSSQLDLLLTSKIECVLKFGQISVPNISHHDLIFASINLESTPAKNDIYYRDYKNIDPNLVLNEFVKFDWQNFYRNSDPEILIDSFNECVKSLHDNCVPIRKATKTRKAKNAWFNSQIQMLMIDRDLAYNKWKLTRDDNDFCCYKRIRNLTNSAITKAKKDYFNHQLNIDVPAKTFWNKLRELGFNSRTLNIETGFSADAVNESLQKNFTASQTTSNGQTEARVDSFEFSRIEEYDTINAVYEISSNAVGLDDLPIKFVKQILPILLKPLTHIFNSIITTGIYPSIWKQSKIIPIRKKPSISSLDNLRPISILCALSKVFERILKKQMCAYLQANEMINVSQSGYRPGHSTKTAMLKICDDVGLVLDSGGKVVMIFLDFSKAFDTISHVKLCDKLKRQFNFGDCAIALIKAYLTNRTQAVCTNNELSRFLPVSSGVPQGSVLGPILFSLYINDLPSIIKYCSVHLFADDVQLYFDCRNMSTEAVGNLINQDLEAIRLWSNDNSLRLNASKTNALIISRCSSDNYPVLCVGNQLISYVDNATSLGYIVTRTFQWDKHVLSQCGKIYGVLRTLYHKAKLLNSDTKLKLFKSFLLPYFVSCDILFSNTSLRTQDRLRVALNSCVRFVYNLNRYDHVTRYQSLLLGCSFYNFFKYRSNIIMYNLITKKCPAYLFEKLRPFRSIRAKRFVIPLHHTAQYANSFFVRGVVYWNSLPNSLKEVNTLGMFKKQCKNYYYHSFICSVA